MTNNNVSLYSLIKELSIFIEALDTSSMISSLYNVQEKVENRIPFSYKVLSEENNIIVLEGKNYSTINEYNARIYKALSKTRGFSKNYIREIIWQALILQVRINRKEVVDSNCSKLLTQLFQKKIETFYVLIQINGFDFTRNNVISLGKAKFYLMTKQRMDVLLKTHKLNKRDYIHKMDIEYYKETYLYQKWAEIIIEANDADAAKENAIIYLDRIIDIINFFVISYNKNYPNIIQILIVYEELVSEKKQKANIFMYMKKIYHIIVRT